jgi:hypothetical protein
VRDNQAKISSLSPIEQTNPEESSDNVF